MIYLVCQCKSGLGEDTFWTWFEREFKNCCFISEPIIPKNFNDSDDCIVVYSTMGPIKNPFNKKYKAFCLAWELYPEMRDMLKSNQWNNIIDITRKSAKSSTEIFVSTDFANEYYKDCGIITKMNLGINTDLFVPLKNKLEIKQKYNINNNKKIGYWGGTNHVMKGFDRLIEYANSNPDVYWIIVWKQHSEVGVLPKNISGIQFVHISQVQINELLNCSDFFLCTSRLRPYYMTELEAMSANIPIVFTENIEKDFVPSSNPRDDIFEKGLDRRNVKQKWIDVFNKHSIKYFL
jgi:glycosyltransferase involved in cell wall biosynthesis